MEPLDLQSVGMMTNEELEKTPHEESFLCNPCRCYQYKRRDSEPDAKRPEVQC